MLNVVVVARSPVVVVPFGPVSRIVVPSAVAIEQCETPTLDHASTDIFPLAIVGGFATSLTCGDEDAVRVDVVREIVGVTAGLELDG